MLAQTPREKPAAGGGEEIWNLGKGHSTACLGGHLLFLSQVQREVRTKTWLQPQRETFKDTAPNPDLFHKGFQKFLEASKLLFSLVEKSTRATFCLVTYRFPSTQREARRQDWYYLS